MIEYKETKSYSDHLLRFFQIESNLDIFFDEYKNKKKILKLLEYWLFAIKQTGDLYGRDGLDSYISTNGSSPIRHAFDYEFKSKIYPINKNVSILLPKIFLFFFNRIILPGAPLKLIKDKLFSKISIFIFSSLTAAEHAERKERLVEILLPYFKDLDLVTSQTIYDSLPSIFFSNQISIKSKTEIICEGTAHSFMDFSGFEKILLLDSELKMNSYQHGGGYDCFNCDYYSYFEKAMSDSFYSWGLGEKNISQTRYAKIDQNLLDTKRQLIWVERPNYPKLMSPLNHGQYLQHSNQKVIENIYKALCNTGRPYLSAPYPGNLRSNDYEGYRGDYLGDGKIGSENFINKCDLVIFDSSAASLIHFCIENSILFFLIVDRKSAIFFTPKKNDWFNLLRENDMAFFHDEFVELSNAIESAYNTDLTIPKKLLDFNKQTFNDLVLSND